MDLLRLMIKNSDLLNHRSSSSPYRVPPINLEELPEILLCKKMNDFK